jgi:UDP-N-acetylglucosamine---dolichyl-phosphate N-acetylglucosaminyltransferase
LQSIPKQIPSISRITPVVVDDNSTDDTQRIAQACGARCIRHELNLGAGGATITGLEMAKKLKADIVVTMDGDGQHAGADILPLIAPITNDTIDVVIGTRLGTNQEEMPYYKRVGNHLLNGVTYLFFRIWVSDSQSGYKAFSKKALDSIELKTIGYEVCSEIIGEIKTKKLTYQEVPITTIYTDYSRSKGQMALNAVNIILGLLLRNIR